MTVFDVLFRRDCCTVSGDKLQMASSCLFSSEGIRSKYHGNEHALVADNGEVAGRGVSVADQRV